MQERSIAGVTVLHRSAWRAPKPLNHTLHVVWTCLSVDSTAAEIVDDIVATLEYDEDIVVTNVDESLRQLLALGVIEPVPR